MVRRMAKTRYPVVEVDANLPNQLINSFGHLIGLSCQRKSPDGNGVEPVSFVVFNLNLLPRAW
jgi:hypothetical protein